METRVAQHRNDSTPDKRRETRPGPLSDVHRLVDALLPRRWLPEGCDELDQMMGTVEESEDRYTLTVRIPGVSKENISLRYNEKSGVLEMVAQETGEGHAMRFERREYLPGVDAQKITSAYKDNLLVASLPKIEQPAAVEIPIK